MGLAKIITVDENKCVNCHRCIGVCPVKFCNDGSGDYVKVNDDLCIGCGECLKACTHDARGFIDDFARFMKDVKSGDKIVAVVAPAIAAEFNGNYMNFNGWLKSIGVKALFDVSFGAELTIKSYLEHVTGNKPKAVIAQPCPAIVTYIEIYKPELLKYLAPADSPMMHTIKLIKHYYPAFSNHKVLIVSPCIAKKREFDEVGMGDYNVTMKSFKDYFAKERINLSSFAEAEFDNSPAERAVLFSTPGGLLRTAQRENPGIINVSRKIEGPNTIYHYLNGLNQDIQKGDAPLLIDCLNCEHGCNGGTGTSREHSQDVIEKAIEKRNLEMQEKYKSKSLFKSEKLTKKKIQKAVNSYWKPGIYGRTYKDLSQSNYNRHIKTPTEAQENEIYKNMLKETHEDHLNCGGCGYNKCKDMAIAIFNGLNKKENCHHYEKKYFTSSVHRMMDNMEKFSNGDLTIRLDTKDDGEVGHIYASFNKASENLYSLVNSLVGLINAAASTSDQISSSAEEMATGAQHQSMQTSEVAVSIDEMTKTILETAKNTVEATEAAKSAGDIAKDGGKVIAATVDGMNKIADVVKRSASTVSELGQSSQQIGEIVQVIHDISDQTNLLALNAAIEAARAGEQGRGFAVVADEVRKLAERTANATKQIASMIDQIQKDTQSAILSINQGTEEVESGKTLADKAGSSLKQIIVGSDNVVNLANQVAAASEEQSATAMQIAKNIENINSVAQNTSTGIQEISRAANELRQMTSELQDIIQRFKLDDSDARFSAAHSHVGYGSQIPRLN